MIRSVMCGAFALLAGSALAIAAPKDDVSAAAKKLASADNYSWKSATENAGGQGGGGGQGRRGGFGGGPVEGKMAEGYTVIVMQMGDNSMQTIRKGEKVVMQTPDGWMTREEMQANNPNAGQGGQGRRGGRGGMMGGAAPGQSAENIINGTKELTTSGDAYEGDLTEEGAKGMLFGGGGRRGGGGQGGPEVSGAKGHAKFWVKDGMLTKYEYTVSGTVSFNGNDREINRTTKVEVSDVGSTKVTIPEEAKKKLES